MKQETLVARISPFIFLKWVVVIEFFFAFTPIALVLIFNLQQQYTELVLARSIPYEVMATRVITTLQILILAISFLAWYLPSYQIDRTQVVYKRGGPFVDKPLARTQAITHITVRQGWLARRLDYGTLVIRTSDAAGAALVRNVPTPAFYVDYIEGLIDPTLVPRTAPETRPVAALIAEGETQHVEFKASLMWDYRQQRVNKELYEPVMKNLVAFMNTVGGTLLVGVSDDGEVLGLAADMQGLRKPNVDGWELAFNAAFNSMVGVEFRRFVEVRFPAVAGKVICELAVRPAGEPAFLTHKGVESFYIRAGNGSQPLTVSKAARYIQSHFAGGRGM